MKNYFFLLIAGLTTINSLASTRSAIALQEKDGSFIAIYCHFDGYVEHNGKLLYVYYNNEQEVRKLIGLGDMSFLDTSIAKPKGHNFDNSVKGYSIFYHRDRKESWKDTKPRKFEHYDNLVTYYDERWCEYIYVFKNQQWYVNDSLLTPQIIENGLAPMKGSYTQYWNEDTTHLRDTENIVSVFNTYKNIMLGYATDTNMYDILHPNIINQYTHLLNTILTIDSTELRNQPMYNLLNVITMRFLVPKDSLTYFATHTKEYINYSFTLTETDWQGFNLYELSYQDSFVIGTIEEQGEIFPEEAALIFYKKGENWLIDLSNFFNFAATYLESQSEDLNKFISSGLMEKAFEAKYKKKAENHLWKPILATN